MADLTDYGENRLIRALLDDLPLGAGTNVHAIGLFKATTNESSQTEVYSSETNGYSRLLVTSLFTDADGGGSVDSNNVVATWTAGGSDWPEITHVGLCATATENASDVIAIKALSSATTVTSGSTISFAATALQFTAV